MCDFFGFTSSVIWLHFLHEVVASVPFGEVRALVGCAVFHTGAVLLRAALMWHWDSRVWSKQSSGRRWAAASLHTLGGKEHSGITLPVQHLALELLGDWTMVLCYPRLRGFVLQPCLCSPLWGVQECSNCETKPGGKHLEGPCSALTEHGKEEVMLSAGFRSMMLLL